MSVARAVARGALRAGLTLFAAWPAGCRATPNEATFHGSPEFLHETRVVAVLPLLMERPTQAGESSPAALVIEQALETELECAGFSTVSAAAFRAVWQREAPVAGGFFDEHTGEPDQAKLDALVRRCLDELQVSQPFDAYLLPSLERVSAPFFGGYARWDGVEERLTGTGELDARLEDYEGRIGAVSLQITIRSRAGATGFDSRGGLGVLARMAGGDFESIPLSEVLADPERSRRAVERALAPLREARAP